MSDTTREEKIIFRAVTIALALVLVAIGSIIYYSSIKSTELKQIKDHKNEAIVQVNEAIKKIHTERGYYPVPDDSVGILAWKRNIIVWQWYIGESLVKRLELPEDVINEKFVYTTTNNGDKYSLGYVFSDGTSVIEGDNIGLFTDSDYKAINADDNPIDDLSETKEDINVFFDGNFKIKLKDNDSALVKSIPLYGFDEFLLAYWDMETLNSKGEMYDLSGHGNNGTVNDAIIGQVEWPVGKSAWFDGKKSFIESQKVAKTIAKQSKFTMSYLMRNNTSAVMYDKTHLAINSDKLKDGKDIVFRAANGADVWTKEKKWALAFAFSDTRVFEKSENLNDNKWHLITITVDRTTPQTQSTVYVDGKKVASYKLREYTEGKKVYKEDNFDKATDFSIGQDYDIKKWELVTSDFYQGLIDEFRLYSRILTDEEIKSLAKTVLK